MRIKAPLNKLLMRAILVLECGIFSLVLLLTEAHAGTYTFIKANNNNDWATNSSLIWNPTAGLTSAGPISTDNVVIHGDGSTVGSLYLQGARAVTNFTSDVAGAFLAGTVTTSGITASLTINGNLSITAGDLTFTNSATTAGGSTADIEVKGNVNISSGTILNVGGAVATAGATLNSFRVTGANSTTSVDGTLRIGSPNGFAQNVSLGGLSTGSSGVVLLGYTTSAGANITRQVDVTSLGGSGNVKVNATQPNTGVSNNVTLNIATGSAANATFSGVLENGTALRTSLALTMTGSGKQTLTGVNTYTGATSITGGTLILSSSGSINNTSGITVSGNGQLRSDSSVGLTRNVTVSSGGTFRYNSASNYTGALTFTNGTIAGTNWNGNLGGLTVGTNQILSPGNSPGTGATTSQTWASGGTYVWEVNNATGTAGTDPGWDLITGTGSLSITATSGSKFNIDITSLTTGNIAGDAANFNSAMSYNWLMADFSSAITFDASVFNIATTNFSNTFTGAFGIVRGDAAGVGGDSSQLYLTYTAPVPEPSTVAILLMGGAGLLMVVRRHARRRS